MIVDKDAQLFERLICPIDSLFKPLEHASETMVLNQKQQLLFRFAVMIETGQADARRARNVAHRSRVIALLGKDARGGAQNVLELLIVSCEVLGHKKELPRRHRVTEKS